MGKLLLAMAQETGHFNATLALAKALRGRGHDVRYLAMPDRAAFLEQQGFETIPIMAAVFPRGSEAASPPAGGGVRARWAARMRRIDRARAAFDGLVDRELDEIVAAHRPDLCLVDPLLPALAVVTERAGFRTLMLSTTLPLARVRGTAPLCSAVPAGDGWLGRARTDAAWARLLATQAVLRRLARLGLRFDRELALERAARDRGFPASRIQTASFYASRVALPELILCPRELEFDAAEVDPTRHYVGPVIDLARREPEFPWHRIAPGRPLVYATLGSAPHQWPHTPRFLDAALAAMHARADWQWVLSTGERAHAAVAPRAPSHAIVVPYAPQLQLLARAQVMVTHAGLNSLKEALWFAVPLVALPCMLDQKGNAARIAHHGLGAVDDIARIDGDRLVARIDGVLADPAIRGRLAAMQQRFERSERAAEGISIIERSLGDIAAPRAAAAPAPASLSSGR